MTKTFQYQSIPDFTTGASSLRPYLPVSICDIDNPVFLETADMLVDSGAEDTVFNMEMATLMNINLKDANPDWIIMGNTKINGVSKQLNLLVEEFGRPNVIKGIFVKGLSVAGILGQRDFFENYRVDFQRSRKSFCVSDSQHLSWTSKIDHEFLTNLFRKES